MSKANKNEVREPLIHLSKRASIRPVRAWTIRIVAVLIGLVVCGIAAFLLIEKLQNDPGRIGEFYQTFIRGSFSTSRKLWKFLHAFPALQDAVSFDHLQAETVDRGDLGMMHQCQLFLQMCIARIFFQSFLKSHPDALPHLGCRRVRKSQHQEPVDIRRVFSLCDQSEDPLHQDSGLS